MFPPSKQNINLTMTYIFFNRLGDLSVLMPGVVIRFSRRSLNLEKIILTK